MWRGQLARFPVRPLWDLRPAAGAHGWMARWLDELPWARGSHWPWRRWRGRDERGWLVVPPPSPRFRRLPQAPVCEPHTDGREEKVSLSPPPSVLLGDSGPPCHGLGKSPTGGEREGVARGLAVRDGRSEHLAVLQAQRSWAGGSRGLGTRVALGPMAWRRGGELQPFLPWMVQLWLRGLLHPSLGDREPAWLPAHSPGHWEPWAHPSLCRISVASVLTSTSAEGSILFASHGRLLPASVPAPRQACFPTLTPDPCAWPCMCVCVCAHVSAHVHACPCVHTYLCLHTCPCVSTCMHVSVCVHVCGYACVCMCYTSQGGLWGALLLKVLISTFCSVTLPTVRDSRK